MADQGPKRRAKRVPEDEVQPVPKRKRGPYKTWVANGNVPPKTLWSRKARESLVCPNASKPSSAHVTQSRRQHSRNNLQSIENTTPQMGVGPASSEGRPSNRFLTPATNVDLPLQKPALHGEDNDQAVYGTDGDIQEIQTFTPLTQGDYEARHAINGESNEIKSITTLTQDSGWERVEECCDVMNDELLDENLLDEEDFILRLDVSDNDQEEGGTEKVEEEEMEAESTTDGVLSESETDDEDLAEAADLNLSIDQRIKLLLLLATKRRHKLTYTCAEDIMELSGVLSKEDEPFLPDRHMIKKTIEKFSFSLVEHHICPNCNKYVGVVTADSFHCNECLKDINTKVNKDNGNVFLYLSLRDQLKALLQTTLSQDDFIIPKNRDKMCKHNYEDIFDGSLYKYDPGQISFNFFVDGVQVATTCKKSAWPVLVTINELPLHLRRKYVLMVSLWLSKKKPDCNEYLKPFVKETNELIRDGVTVKKFGVETTVRVKPCCCISDSIARPLLRNSSQFNGRFGCGFCYHPGVKMRKGRGIVRSYTFRDGPYPYRTHEELMTDALRAEQLGTRQRGIKGKSVLSGLPNFNMVHSIDLDLFHALVNTAKRFASLWFDKGNTSEPYNIRSKLSEVDNRLLSIRPTSDVSRAPRSLEERSDYRGHEWYFWVAAYSVPCLKNLLPQKYLNHWAHLVYGITLIMQNSVSKCDVAYSERHINLFISGIDELYGSQNVTFSIHLLSHLCQSVKNFAQPWSHSAFIFESFNNEIKNCVKSSNGAALQICKEMQMKVALKKLEDDVRDHMSVTQKSYLKKISECSKKLAAPHQSIGSAHFLGMPRVCTLPLASVTAIVRSGGKCDANTLVSVYDRCSVGGVLYQSVNYTKVSKQNNSLAQLESNEVFLIDSFVVLSSQCYVLGYFYELRRNQKLCDVELPHYRVLKTNHEGTLRCVGINELLSKLLLITVQISPTEILNIAYVNVLQMEMLS